MCICCWGRAVQTRHLNFFFSQHGFVSSFKFQWRPLWSRMLPPQTTPLAPANLGCQSPHSLTKKGFLFNFLLWPIRRKQSGLYPMKFWTQPSFNMTHSLPYIYRQERQKCLHIKLNPPQPGGQQKPLKFLKSKSMFSKIKALRHSKSSPEW